MECSVLPPIWQPAGMLLDPQLNTSNFAPVHSEGGDIAPLTAADQERGMAHDNPNQMTSEERTGEVAALLAAGFLRFRQRPGGLNVAGSATSESPENSPELSGGSSQNAASCASR